MIGHFFAAVKAADTARVRELLASDVALVRARDDHGPTALHHAAERGHREVVNLLLDAGADLNARDDRFGATPAGGRSSTFARAVGSWARRSRTCCSRSASGTRGGCVGW